MMILPPDCIFFVCGVCWLVPLCAAPIAWLRLVFNTDLTAFRRRCVELAGVGRRRECGSQLGGGGRGRGGGAMGGLADGDNLYVRLSRETARTKIK